jgi:hypothetical protein
MMAFKQRFNSLLRQQAAAAAAANHFMEEESNPQHRPASLVFDQYTKKEFNNSSSKKIQELTLGSNLHR